MAPRRQSSSPQRLGGKAFPAHQLKRSLQYAFCGALIFLFIAPWNISAFRTNDSSSVSARPGLTFFCVVFIVWTVGWLASFLKYRDLARATYDKALLVPGSTRRSHWASRARWILAWLSATLWAVLVLAGRTTPTHPNTVTVSPWLAFAFFLTGIGALILTGILGDRATGIASSEAFHLEEARGLKDEIQIHEASLRDKTDSIAESLGERISKRIVDLERLSDEVGSTQRKRELIQTEVDAEMQALNREIYGISARRDHRRQWGFALLSFVLGFVVNGLTVPVLDLFRGIHI
jgi:hypothetical protein